MKKLLSILLTLALVLSFSTVAFANTEVPVAVIPKSFTLVNADKLNPAETFTFTFSQQAATTNTNLTTVTIPDTTIAYSAGENGSKNGSISLTNFATAAVGRYTYAVAETQGDTAGLDYTTRTGTLVVDKESDGTVKSYLIIGTIGTTIQGKYDNFDNTFSAGDLLVKKTVAGNLGDKTKEFDVTVTLTAPTGKTVENGEMELYKNGGATSPATMVNFAAGTATVTFKVKHDDVFTIKNLPYGVTYVVAETDPANGYTVTYTGKTGTIGAASQETVITNTKSSEIPTGITLESLPYILLLGFAVLGMGVLFFRKRRSANF